MDVDELTIHKLKIVPTDLSKLSNEVDNDVVKKTVYDELFKKVNSIHAIDISELLKETDNDTKTKDIMIIILLLLNLINFLVHYVMID